MSRARTLIVVVGLVAIVGVGYRATSTGIINFWSAPRAPQSARSAFTRDALLPKAVVRRLKLAQTRRIATAVFRGVGEQLFVAPAAGGEFCFEWASEPGDPGIWVDEFGGCGIPSRPMIVAYDDLRISIVANAPLVDIVRAKLSDGREVQLNLRWVSAPIDAGFLVYQQPKGLQVVQVEALKGTRVAETDPITAMP